MARQKKHRHRSKRKKNEQAKKNRVKARGEKRVCLELQLQGQFPCSSSVSLSFSLTPTQSSRSDAHAYFIHQILLFSFLFEAHILLILVCAYLPHEVCHGWPHQRQLALGDSHPCLYCFGSGCGLPPRCPCFCVHVFFCCLG